MSGYVVKYPFLVLVEPGEASLAMSAGVILLFRLSELLLLEIYEDEETEKNLQFFLSIGDQLNLYQLPVASGSPLLISYKGKTE